MVSTRLSDLAPYIARLALRSALSREATSALRDLPGRVETLKSGQVLIGPRSRSDEVPLVVDGLLASYIDTASGGRQIVAVHMSGDMAGAPTMMLPETTCGTVSLTRSTVTCVSRADLQGLADRHITIAKALARDAAVDASVMSQWMLNIGRKSALARVAHLFCELATRYELIGKLIELSFDLPMTQEQIADATAMTPVHVNRTLMELRGNGIVTMHSRIVRVLNWSALTLVGGFERRYLDLPRESSANIRGIPTIAA